MSTPLRIIGLPPLAKNADGKLVSSIGTLFPAQNTLITLTAPHATQRQHLLDLTNEARVAQGLQPFDDGEELAFMMGAVDLIMRGDDILIRPNPDDMALADAADERLQTLASKRNILFLWASDPKVFQAIRARGEYWRISRPPLTEEAILVAISQAKAGLAGQQIYYYCAATGIRYLTCEAFEGLALLSNEALRAHLAEVQTYAAKRNRLHKPEIAFFAADGSFGAAAFAGLDFAGADAAQVRRWHADLAARFRSAVHPDFQRDAPLSPAWRHRMFNCLFDTDDTRISPLIGDLTPEFFLKIRWLPGGRFERGELIFDTIFEDRGKYAADEELQALCDERVKGFIANYVCEFGSIEHVNIGWILPSIRRHHPRGDGHGVYLAEIKPRGATKPVLRVIRMQRWSMRHHLEQGHTYEHAASQVAEYMEYTRDRRLACWELGMPLPGRIDVRMLFGSYEGEHAHRCKGLRICTYYFEREFIKGLATDKIPADLMKRPDFALSVARLLGSAAAPNLAVGRTVEEKSTEVVFDDGDEMIISDASGNPQRIVVADHAGTFHDFKTPLACFAEAYAEPVRARLAVVGDPDAFKNAYLDAMCARLLQLQAECREQRNAFTALFQNSKQGDETFSDRWLRVRDRLERTNVQDLIARIRLAIEAPMIRLFP
jgi:hypothetical protein